MEIIISVLIAFYLPQLAGELKARAIRHHKHYRA